MTRATGVTGRGDELIGICDDGNKDWNYEDAMISG